MIKKIILTPLVFILGCLMLIGLITFYNLADLSFANFEEMFFIFIMVLLISASTTGLMVFVLNRD